MGIDELIESVDSGNGIPSDWVDSSDNSGILAEQRGDQNKFIITENFTLNDENSGKADK